MTIRTHTIHDPDRPTEALVYLSDRDSVHNEVARPTQDRPAVVCSDMTARCAAFCARMTPIHVDEFARIHRLAMGDEG